MYAVSISNLPAGADLRKGQIIRRDTGTWVAAVATNAEAVCGNTCKTGDLVNAIVAGLAEVECATALTVGGRITCDGNGRAVNTTATATHIQLGLVIEPGKAAAAGAFTYATVVLDALKVTLT